MPESMSFAELRPVRALTRRPIFSLLAVATVATAVAASTAAFVLVDSAFVAPLPYAQPSRLVTVDVISERGFGISISVPNYRDWGSAPSVFEKVGASAGWNVVLSGRGPARVVDVREVLGDFFDVLGVRAARGRVLEARDTDRDSPPTVVPPTASGESSVPIRTSSDGL